MTLSLTCQKCGKRYSKIKRSLIGRRVRCSCGSEMRVGDTTSSEPEVPSGENPEAPRPSTNLDHHYHDLDQILSGTGTSQLPLPRGRPRVADPATKESKSSAPLGLTVSLLSVVASASMAFWFGSLIVSSRFTQLDQFLLKGFSETLSNINQGQFGLEAVAPGVKVGFVVCGWLIWTLALAMIVLAVLQFTNAVVQLFIQRQPMRWADGLMAACGVAILFLFVGTLFLHATHTARLGRELNRHDTAAGILAGESDLQNVQRLREQYAQESQHFLTVILVAGAVPLSVFGCSMVRLMTRR